MVSSEQPTTAFCWRRPCAFMAIILLAGAYRLLDTSVSAPAEATRLAEISVTLKEPPAAIQNKSDTIINITAQGASNRLAEVSVTTKEPAVIKIENKHKTGIKMEYPYISQDIISLCGLEEYHQDKPLQPLTKSLAFIKTHKTGSSTVANIVNRIAYGRNLTKMIPGNLIHLGWPTSFPGDVQDMELVLNQTKYDAVANHAVFHDETWRQYLKEPMFFTILREPVKRTISAFQYFKPYSDGRHTWREFLDHYTAKKFVDEWRDPVFLNDMAYSLGWYHSHDPVPNDKDHDKMQGNKWTTEYDHNVTAIQTFIDKLDLEIDLAMILENLTESLLLLQDELPELELAELVWSNQKVAVAKPTPGRRGEPSSRRRKLSSKVYAAKGVYPTESEQEELSKMLLVDRMLYNHFHAKFMQRWDAKVQSSPLETTAQKKGLGCLYATISQQLSVENDGKSNTSDMTKVLLPDIFKDNLQRDSKRFTKVLAHVQKKRLDAEQI